MVASAAAPTRRKKRTTGEPTDARYTLARLVAVYRLPPDTILKTPLYLLHILSDQVEMVEAQQQLARTTAALAPHWNAEHLRAYLRELEGLAYPDRTYGPRPMPKIEIDADKARAWFEAAGVRVVKAS